jgi:mRNA interferase MazF
MSKLTQVLRSATNTPKPPPYCPDAGDVIDINFDPQAGREQAGRRPAFVLSPRAYNARVQLCIACPITNQPKGYPFEVLIPGGLGVSGAVLSDHIKSMSWQARDASFRCAVPPEILNEVRAKIAALLQFN